MSYQKPKIKLFTEPNFKGLKQVHKGSANSLARSGFNDQISSIIVKRGVWVLFKAENFEGDAFVYSEGQKINLPCGADNKISSLKPIFIDLDEEEPSCNIYEHANFKGRCMHICRDQPDLSDLNFNNILSSIEVLGGGWIGFAHKNYEGKQYIFTPGEWSMFSEYGTFRNDSISSLKAIKRVG